MLKNQDIICISSIDWDFVWQGHQEIMATFAKNGNRVLFIENTGIRTPNLKDIGRLRKRLIRWFKSLRGFREEMDNLYVYSPVILPFPYSKVARWFNRFLLIKPIRDWLKVMEFRKPIIWTFLPTGIALDIAENIEKKLLVYYCIADFYELVSNCNKLKRSEDKLINKSDVIFAQGDVLKEKCKKLNDNVHIFPFGVNTEVFSNLENDAQKAFEDIKAIKKPIVGYIGGIHRHIDFELLRFMACARPEWSIVLIGPQQTDVSQISDLENVYLLGKKDLEDLPNYIKEFDAGIIPYKVSKYTATVYPTKLNEYHIMGKAVVATDLPEVTNANTRNGNLVLIAKTHDEFLSRVSEAIADTSDELQGKRILSAKENSWSSRIKQMSSLLEDAIDIKSTAPSDWKEALVGIYRKSRRKLIKFSALILGMYVLMFHTPLLWYAAGPLKISDVAKPADAIVVFGGGVGETGSPGKSTIERSRYAVGLYKEGYADKIIFSSGYTYTYNDAENMRLFAISMGVPKRSIILEEKANSTYENVRLTKDILDKNKLRSILLVSSPYNMRRASLVFKKHAPAIAVIYTPVKISQFYDKTRGVRLEQIRAIAHEYLGILYYWFKRYV